VAGDAPNAPVTWKVEVITHVPESAPKDLGLQLTVKSLDGKAEVFELEATGKPQRIKRANESLQGRKDTYTVELPKGFEPAAVVVLDRDDAGDAAFQKEGEYSQLFLKSVSMRSASGQSIDMIANTYISTAQGPRLFVRDDALTNPKLAGNQELEKLMEQELKELRGEGENSAEARKMPRDNPDRIYRYDIYNDLGGDIVKNPGNKRTPLGGTYYPYPRRLDTNRGKYEATNYEVAPTTATGALVTTPVISSIFDNLPGPIKAIVRVFAGLIGAVRLLLGLAGEARKADGVLATPWTPQDDNFDTDKARGFIGNAVSGILPGVLTTIDSALGSPGLFGLSPGKEFDSVGEVLSLYDKDDLAPDGSSDGIAARLKKGIAERARSGFLARVNRRTGLLSSDDNDDDIEDLLKYDVPRCLEDRLPTWDTDEEMGRMYLAGQNPMVIQVLSPTLLAQLLEGSPGIQEAASNTDLIAEKLEGKSLAEWAAAGDSSSDPNTDADEPRLFLVDYWAVHGFLDVIEEANRGSDRVMHAGRCVLFRKRNGHVVPVIIELAHSKALPPTTYTSMDPAPVWQVAKSIFQSVDSGWHQLVSHWLRTHACVEPYLIATRRRLPAAHPIFRLMMPHFRYTLPINAAARGQLINAGGVIETNFSPGAFSMQLSSKVYELTWRFKEEGLVEDLKKRGFLDAQGKLRVSDYPYAEDGLLIWDALTKYFTEYVDLYYKSDEAVAADEWLQAWWQDVTTEAHPDAPADGWVTLDSRANLVFAATTIAWVASGHHAAVNFGQYDYSAWMPTHSSLCGKPAPARGSTAWQKLEDNSVSSKEFFSYLSPPAATTKVMSTIKLLSAHADDEQYLSDENQEWLPLKSDPAVANVFSSFVKDIKGKVEPEIQRRNDNATNISRNPEQNGLPYTLLYPSSDKPGVTMQGVPYSISI